MKSETKIQIGQNLKRIRKEKGYTQADIANYLDSANTTIASWEQGISSPDIQTAYRLSKYYNVALECFLEGVDL